MEKTVSSVVENDNFLRRMPSEIVQELTESFTARSSQIKLSKELKKSRSQVSFYNNTEFNFTVSALIKP